MSRTSESGRGRLSTLFWLAALATLGYVVYSVGPLYYANYVLQDKLEAIARTPRSRNMEASISKGIRDAIKEASLEGYLNESDFKIATEDLSRSIRVEYDREANILPGMQHTFHMVAKADARFF